MKFARPSRASGDFFHECLEAIIDPRHPLVRLGRLLTWDDSEERFGKFYKPIGRPAKPMRLSSGISVRGGGLAKFEEEGSHVAEIGARI